MQPISGTLAQANSTAEAQAARGLWSRRFTTFWSAWDARASAIFLALAICLMLVPGSLWPDSANEINLMLRHQAPSITGNDSQHWLGTDALGRDMFWRILSSTRLTLLIAGLATVIATVTGTIAGLASGYMRGRTDTIISRFVDIMLAFPVLLLVLALVAALGRSVTSVVLVLGLSGWAGYTRVIRSATLTVVEQEFVEAAQCVGAGRFHIMFRHLLPNVASPIFVLATLNLASFILTESAISFLGLGPEPPSTTWGGLIGDGRNYMFEAWWVTLFPGVAIVLTVLAFNLIGDAIRDAFDPFANRNR
ncbi:MAG: ABC transporter permease [Thermomicrobiales bacterium]|nr:ABC transporter permease [Thermomicrobiales bacterium]